MKTRHICFDAKFVSRAGLKWSNSAMWVGRKWTNAMHYGGILAESLIILHHNALRSFMIFKFSMGEGWLKWQNSIVSKFVIHIRLDHSHKTLFFFLNSSSNIKLFTFKYCIYMFIKYYTLKITRQMKKKKTYIKQKVKKHVMLIIYLTVLYFDNRL